MYGRIHRFARSVTVDATPDALFDYLDDPGRLGAHMSERSLMMPGGRMHYRLDAAAGKAVGSLIRMEGRMLGMSLRVEEVITERHPPSRKVWETVGPQRMIVIRDYRLGFEIHPVAGVSALQVFIDYTLPETPAGYLLGWLFAPLYARWCVSRIAEGARRAFPARRGP